MSRRNLRSERYIQIFRKEISSEKRFIQKYTVNIERKGGQMGDLRYCFEEGYVEKTLKNTMEKGLAVIDSDGIPENVIR